MWVGRSLQLHQLAAVEREDGVHFREFLRRERAFARDMDVQAAVAEPQFGYEQHVPTVKRVENKTRKVKHDFAFTSLVHCGHCGCHLVGELKKGRYVYYHCTGNRGKCPEPY